MVTGNKGEWSEFYALIKLLSTGKLFAADENAERLSNIFFPILKIFRTEQTKNDIEYVICSSDQTVEIHIHEHRPKKILQSDFVVLEVAIL